MREVASDIDGGRDVVAPDPPASGQVSKVRTPGKGTRPSCLRKAALGRRANANRGPDHGKAHLPMANTNDSSGAGQSLSPQGTVEFKVPKAYWEHFRAGVVFDLAWDTNNAVERYEKGYRHRLYGHPPEWRGYVDLEIEDHTGPLRYIAQSAALIAAMEDACPAAEKPEGDIAITGDPEAMIFGLHALAERIAGPMITAALGIEATEPNPEAREWMAVATWALDAIESLEPSRRAVTKERAEAGEEEKA